MKTFHFNPFSTAKFEENLGFVNPYFWVFIFPFLVFSLI